jgi:hypothetical protein
VIVAVVVIILAVLVVQYIRGMAGDTATDPGASNTAGPAEGGALETGGALDQTSGYDRLPARDMPDTVASYPPNGPETASPPPPQP